MGKTLRVGVEDIAVGEVLNRILLTKLAAACRRNIISIYHL